jgi:hypothetical protein
MTLPLVFSAAFRFYGPKLEIGYKVENRGEQPVYLADVAVFVEQQGPKVRSNRPEIEVAAPNVAVIRHTVSGPQPGVRYATPPRFYTTLLPAGETRRARIRLPLPLSTRGFRSDEPHREVVCARVRWVLGVIAGGDELDPYPYEVDGKPVCRLGPMAWRRQQEYTAETEIQPPVTVLLASKP